MIRKKIFGEEHNAVGTSYNNLGMVYHSIGEYDHGREIYIKAVMIKKKIFGDSTGQWRRAIATWGRCTTALGNTIKQ